MYYRKHQSLQFIEIRAMIETHSGAVVEAKEDILRITERYHRHNDTERYDAFLSQAKVSLPRVFN